MEEKKTLQEVNEMWRELLTHRDGGDDCATCEHSKACFFASYGYGKAPKCVWEI